jgi:hypothetical protein
VGACGCEWGRAFGFQGGCLWAGHGTLGRWHCEGGVRAEGRCVSAGGETGGGQQGKGPAEGSRADQGGTVFAAAALCPPLLHRGAPAAVLPPRLTHLPPPSVALPWPPCGPTRPHLPSAPHSRSPCLASPQLRQAQPGEPPRLPAARVCAGAAAGGWRAGGRAHRLCRWVARLRSGLNWDWLHVMGERCTLTLRCWVGPYALSRVLRWGTEVTKCPLALCAALLTAGFPTRKPFMPFAQRYALLLPDGPAAGRPGSGGGGSSLPLTRSGFIDWFALGDSQVGLAGLAGLLSVFWVGSFEAGAACVHLQSALLWEARAGARARLQCPFCFQPSFVPSLPTAPARLRRVASCAAASPPSAAHA